MKLYQYDDLKKTNQALGSFKRNEVPVEEVKLVTIEGKVQFFIVADPPYTPRPEEDKPKKKADKEPKAEEKKVEAKVEKKAEVKAEAKVEKKEKTKEKEEKKK